MKSCTMFAVQADGRALTTVEGLSDGGAAPGPGRVQGGARAAVRVLHAGDDAGRRGAARAEPRPDRRRGAVGDLRQHLPLHRLHEHRQGHPGRGRGHGRRRAAAAEAPRHDHHRARWRPRTPRSAASATASSATRTTASSRARATTSTTSRCPACCTWRSCGRPSPTRGSTGIDTSAAAAVDGVVAVVTGELMAQHSLAWMPTLSGDTQAVLATDKVRFQGQEVAAVVATDPYIAEDALELIDVDYELLPADHDAAAGAGRRRGGDPRRQGRPDRQPRLRVGERRRGRDRRGVRRGRPGRDARDVLPALAPGAAGDVRHPRRRQLGRPGRRRST